MAIYTTKVDNRGIYGLFEELVIEDYESFKIEETFDDYFYEYCYALFLDNQYICYIKSTSVEKLKELLSKKVKEIVLVKNNYDPSDALSCADNEAFGLKEE